MSQNHGGFYLTRALDELSRSCDLFWPIRGHYLGHVTRINQSEASIYLELDTGGLSLPPLLNTGEVTQSLEPRLKITNQRPVYGHLTNKRLVFWPIRGHYWPIRGWYLPGARRSVQVGEAVSGWSGHPGRGDDEGDTVTLTPGLERK